MKYLVLLALLVGCPQSGAEEPKEPSPFDMTCTKVAVGFRCENQEVICYQAYVNG